MSSRYKERVARGVCGNCGSPKRPLIPGKHTCEECLQRKRPVEYYLQNNKRTKQRRERHREAVLQKLGNQCARCGFIDKRALQLDHIEGGGNREYRARGFNYYKYMLKLLSDPELKKTIQILCANCNWIKRVERNETSKGPVAPAA